MTDKTLGSVLGANLKTNPDREVLIFRDRRYTCRQVSEQVDRLAESLTKLGIRKGDNVALDLPNWPEFVFAFFAITHIGAVAVLVNPRYREREFKHLLRDSRSVAIILPVEFEHFRYAPMIQNMRSELPDLRHVIAVGEKSDSQSDVLYLDELVAGASGESIPEAQIDPAEDIALLMYTSATKGKPKGAMVTHSNFVKTTINAAEPFEITSADVFLVVVPVTHTIGLFCLCSAFFAHAKAVLVDVFKAVPVVQIIEREKVTIQYAGPTAFTLELANADRKDLASLRAGMLAGSSVPAELVRRLLAMNIQVHVQYGKTETAGALTGTRSGDDLVVQTETVGRALTGVEIKFVDDNRFPVAEGQVGEIAVRSAGVMKGYFQQPGATAAALDSEGWYYTGDLGCRDSRGYIRIVGRKKDMIKRGGYSIYPREIEDLLYTCPNVQEAVVIGIPDRLLGEKICACIRKQPNAALTESQIKEFCRGKVADYKIPDYVRFVESFPQTATGKIYKTSLKEEIGREIANHPLGQETHGKRPRPQGEQPRLGHIVSGSRWVIPLCVALLGIGYTLVAQVWLRGHTLTLVPLVGELLVLGIVNPLIVWLILNRKTKIENARLFQVTKHRYETMAGLHETSLDIIARLDTSQLLEALLHRGAQLLHAKGGMLYLYDASRRLIRTEVTYNTARDWSGITFRLGEGLIGRVILTGQPMINNDLTWPGHSEAFEGGTQNRIVGVPLKWENEIIGGIEILNDANGRSFDNDDIWLLSQFADLASIAVKNAELHTQIKQFSQHLEQKVVERTWELSQARNEIAIKAEQLRTLWDKTILLQERERARIARDIHDGVIQLIAGARLEIKATRVVTGAALPSFANEKLEALREILDEMERELRRAIYDLQPPILNALGLTPALQKHVDAFQKITGITCTMLSTSTACRLPSSMEIAVFRIVEESLQNVISHAQATEASVTLDFAPTQLHVTVQDNGQGFDPSQSRKNGNGQGLGLLGMRERVQSLNGEMELISAPGQGTQLAIRLPISGVES